MSLPHSTPHPSSLSLATTPFMYRENNNGERTQPQTADQHSPETSHSVYLLYFHTTRHSLIQDLKEMQKLAVYPPLFQNSGENTANAGVHTYMVAMVTSREVLVLAGMSV